MSNQEFELCVRAANEQLGTNSRNRVIGAHKSGDAPRFELFHSAPSLCSHKVRTVLAEKGVPYKSHDMNIMPVGKAIPENYQPSYVRLRLLGGQGKEFVEGYTGQSSVTSQGFDPCVVPTLIDHKESRVVIDSAYICDYLDREAVEGEQLIPDELAVEISSQADFIDCAPHVAILYGANPDGDIRPHGLQAGITGIQDKKIIALNRMIAGLPDGDPVVAAYKSKIAKESGSSHFVADEDCMRKAYADMAAHANQLEAQLQKHDQPWVLGDRYTMADILWTVSLYRLKWIGLAYSWEQENSLPRVAEYVQRAFKRPSFQSAVVQWPFAYAPSPHIPVSDTPAAKLGFLKDLLMRQNWLKVAFG